MPLLVRTPAPKADESLFGYLVRLTEANGYKDYATLLRLAGASTGTINAVTHSLQFEGIAGLVGRAPPELEQIAYRTASPRGPRFKLLNHDLGRFHHRLLRLSPAAYCPICLKDSGYVSAFWDLQVAVACPRHGCRPVRRCDACHDHLQWRRPALNRCACEAPLPRETAAVTDETLLGLMQAIDARLSSQPVPSIVAGLGFPMKWFNDAPLASILRTVHLLGRQSLVDQQREVEDFAVAEEASRILSGWPHGYRRFLDSVRDGALQLNPDAAGLSAFQPFYSKLFRIRSLSDTEMFHEEFKRYCPTVQTAEVRIGRRNPVASAAVAPVAGAVERTYRVGRPRTLRFGDREGAEAVYQIRRVDPRDAARFLGLPLAVLQELRLREVYRASFPRSVCAGWDVRDIEAFATRARRLLLVLEPPGGIVGLGAVMAYRLTVKEKAEIVAEVLTGQVRVCGFGASSFGDLWVAKKDVDECIGRMRDLAVPARPMMAAAAMLSLYFTSINAAIAAGLLQSLEIRGRKLVTLESIQEFDRTYVALAKVARELNTTTRRLLRCALSNGIPVIRLKWREDPTQPIIRRTDQKSLLAAFRRDMAQPSRVSPAATATRSLQQYLARLHAKDADIPRHGSKPNISAIANKCGFERYLFQRYPRLVEQVREFDERMRSVGKVRSPQQKVSDYLDGLRKRGQSLRMWKGRPNELAITRACAISRNSFLKSPELREHVLAFARTMPRR
jgi:hypothetical protein